ncbi:unnamed protein product [Chrysodeixis includens]|uniref:Uncharacterized protein n=1 Tax=Chrysodeixis includens TaxID=689277 RepID=A0A9N8KT83_CHRIL|nr:unnamed protein product [Chrysodeixis includens]
MEHRLPLGGINASDPGDQQRAGSARSPAEEPLRYCSRYRPPEPDRAGSRWTGSGAASRRRARSTYFRVPALLQHPACKSTLRAMFRITSAVITRHAMNTYVNDQFVILVDSAKCSGQWNARGNVHRPVLGPSAPDHSPGARAPGTAFLVDVDQALQCRTASDSSRTVPSGGVWRRVWQAAAQSTHPPHCAGWTREPTTTHTPRFLLRR